VLITSTFTNTASEFAGRVLIAKLRLKFVTLRRSTVTSSFPVSFHLSFLYWPRLRRRPLPWPSSYREVSWRTTPANSTKSLAIIPRSELASCLIYSYTLIEYINRFAADRMVTFFFTMLPSVKFSEEKVLVFFILRKNAKIVQLQV